VACSPMTCDCSTTTSSAGGVVSSLANVTMAVAELKPNALDQCCPLCRAQPQQQPPQPQPHQQQHQHLHVQMPQYQAKCRHQELSNVTFASHQRWIYQCHTCECLVTSDPTVVQQLNSGGMFECQLLFQNGETDCWPLECPPVYCTNAYVPAGDCCPRCPDDPCNPPSDAAAINGAQPDVPSLGCHYRGQYYAAGEEWTSGLDGCTTCKCQVRQLPSLTCVEHVEGTRNGQWFQGRQLCKVVGG
jgi:hypothetical protein